MQESTASARVRHIRLTEGLTAEKFGKRIGVTRATISAIETGKNRLTDQMVKSICREFGINEIWLRDGNGEMYAIESMSEKLKSYINQVMNSTADDEKIILALALARSTPEQRKALIGLAHSIIEIEKTRQACNANADTEAAEAAYREALGFVLPEESSASNISDDIRARRETGERKEPYEEEKESV